MTVSYNEIPSDIHVPLFWAEIDNSKANTTSDGTAPALLLGYANSDAAIIRNGLTIMPSAGLAGSMAGRGSQLARMVNRYRNVDPTGELWVIALDEPLAGVAATGTITVVGSAQESGTVYLYIGAEQVQAGVTADDTASDVATTIAAAINANTDLPVTATIAAGVVTLTARHKGLCGNDIPVTINYCGIVGGETTPNGLTITIVAMSGGTGAPTLTNAIAAMGDDPFDFIGTPFNDMASVNTIHTEIASRWGYSRQLYGHAYSAKIDALSTLVAYGDSLNLPHVTMPGYEPATQTAADELVAMRTARNAIFIRNDPARPTQTGVLTGALPAPKGSRFMFTEQQSLLSHGIATAYVESGSLLIQRDITMYQTNSYGVSDNSFYDSETLHTSAYVMRQLKSVITSKYPRHKLANDGTRFGAGQAIVTPAVIKGELLAVYRRLERAGIVENYDLFKKYLVVERSADDPDRLDVLFPPDYINQLRVFAVVNQFRLQYDDSEA
ncbi:phage tail sheath subtilisin-like domain-containing protein [Brenneria uluponensis]|uniref:phage tail sheath subtilisin-like domain-containing protein n=1 Tax=Brenneria uluponensis TaxID=3057057 RepID=UPI0028E6A424|nr:phage tail sheath subtilisin-like domain-containing protein [Brenneria ulupoensis]